MRYLVVVEEGATSFGARVLDLPGCVAVAETRNEVLALIKEAIEFHIQGLRDEEINILNPHVSSEFVDVQAADPALVRDGTNRAGCWSFLRWGAAGTYDFIEVFDGREQVSHRGSRGYGWFFVEYGLATGPPLSRLSGFGSPR